MVTDRMVGAVQYHLMNRASYLTLTDAAVREIVEIALREQPAPAPEPVAWLTDLPQGYEPHEIPHDYTGPLFIEGQMRRFAEAETVRLREAARMALGALERWDGLIEHQYTGSSAAMTDMHLAAQATVPVLEALREALGEKDE